MILDPFGYLHTPWRCSTKPFTKRFSRCAGKSTCISCFFALCSLSAQSLNMVHVSWSWTRSDTFTLHEDAPQNRLRNGYAVVKVSLLVFRLFLLMLSAKSLTISDVTAWLSLPMAQGARAAFLAPGLPWASPKPAADPALPHTDFPKKEIGYMCSLLSYLMVLILELYINQVV